MCTVSKDSIIRRMCVKDINHQENKLRLAGRTVVSLVNLLTLDVKMYFIHAMAEVEMLRKERVLRRRKPAKLMCGDRHYKYKLSWECHTRIPTIELD